jgi:HEAT repeat protein
MKPEDLDSLSQKLSNRSAGKRCKAIRQIYDRGDIPSALIPQLITIAERDKSREVAYYALAAYMATQPAPEQAIPILVRLLNQSSRPKTIREEAAVCLRVIGADGVRALISHAASSDGLVRTRTIRELGECFRTGIGRQFKTPASLGIAPGEILQALVKGLGDKDTEVRNAAAEALKSAGKLATPTLRRALDSGDSLSRAGAAVVLSRLSQLDSCVAERLVQDLSDTSADVRRDAAEALGKLTDRADIVVKPLFNALLDEDPSVCHAATYSLREIRQLPPDGASILSRGLSNGSWQTRRCIGLLICELGTSARSTVPAIVSCLEELAASYADLETLDRRAGVALCYALASMGSSAAEALPVVRLLMQSDRFGLIQEAVVAAYDQITSNGA